MGDFCGTKPYLQQVTDLKTNPLYNIITNIIYLEICVSSALFHDFLLHDLLLYATHGLLVVGGCGGEVGELWTVGSVVGEGTGVFLRTIEQGQRTPGDGVHYALLGSCVMEYKAEQE